MSRRILFLTFHYPPDISPAAYRTGSLVQALAHRIEQEYRDVRIDVLTTYPRRLSSAMDALPPVHGAAVNVHRIQLPPLKYGFSAEARAFARYAHQVGRFTRRKQYDLIFTTSSRLMMAVLAAGLASGKNASLYVDLRDNFVANLKEMMKWPLALPFIVLFGTAERLALRRASKISVNSEGLKKYYHHRYSKKNISCFPNGVDPLFHLRTTRRKPGGLTHILYAGNMGDGQGLHLIIPPLAKRLEGRARFTLIGNGRRRQELQRRLDELQVTNVRLLMPLPRLSLISHYEEADVLFLHLNKYDSFKQVLPSKLFEYAATGRPICAGVLGYPRQFLEAHVANCSTFNPCEVEGAIRALDQLDINTITPREAFAKEYARHRISDQMASDILSLLD